MPEALVLGELCLDVIVYNPQSVAVLGQPIWAEDIVLRLGGSATYAAQALHALGLEVSLGGIVGEDATTEHWLGRLKEEGINVEGVRRQDKQPTPKCIGICKGGQKHFIACSPFLRCDPETLKFPLEGIVLLYFGGYLLYPELWDGLLARLFEEAKSHHTLIALDTQLLPIPSDLFKEKALAPSTMRYIDVLLVNRKEALTLTGCAQPTEAAAELGALGPQTVVVKLGSAGCLTWSQGKCIPSRSVDVEAYDPIGSGDYFGAAFAYGLLRGWNLQRVSDFANTFAALCISRARGRKLPSREETLATLGREKGEPGF